MGEPTTLKSAFASAEQQRQTLEDSAEAGSPTYQRSVASALQSYEECLRHIDQVSLFSLNEGLEDIATSDLPYLLVNYRVAELSQKVSPPTSSGRKSVLSKSREAYEKFLHLLDSYSVLSPSDSKLFSQYMDDPSAFSTVATADPAARRNAKIANFRIEKELKSKLAYMRNSPRYREDGGNEEAVRELHLANTAFCTHMAFQGLEGVNKEAEVLAMAPVTLLPETTTVEADERRRVMTDGQNGYSERLDPPLKRLESAFSGPLLSTEGKPLRPFTLTSDRQGIQQGVFRPGHNLPTMSIDEYLAEERRQGNIIEGGGEASMRQEEPDEDNVDKADAEIMKLRDWDEFREANPKGSGNTLNRG